jgi:hypothetical protein
MAYIGRPLNAGNLAVMSAVGNGSSATPIATLDYATTTNGIAVYLDGVRQLPSVDFNVTNQTTLTFTTAPANGVGIDVYFLGLEVSIPTPADSSISTAKIANNAVDETKLKDALIGDFTDATVTASDTFLYGDATDSGNTKRDTVQGILDLAGGGTWTISSSGAIPASTETWNLTGITTTTKIIMTDLTADGTASPDMYFRTSTNGGSSYDSGASDYASDYAYGGSYGAATYGRDTSAAYGRFSPSSVIADGTTSITQISIEIWHPDVATKATTVHIQSQSTNNNVQWEEVWAARLAAGAVNAISIYSGTTGRSFTGNYKVLVLN